MTRRLLPVLLLILLAAYTVAGPAAAAGVADDPFPIGACVDVPPAGREPTCVTLDPTS